MAVLKVIEVLSSSPTSWEDATQKAVQQASITTGTGTKNISITLGDNIRNVLEKLIESQSSLKPGDCTAESQFN